MTTGLPLFSAASSSDRAGSMPPITSTTMSTSGRVASAVRVRGEQRPVDLLGPAVPDPPDRDPGKLQPRADAERQVIGLLGEQPRHLGADDPQPSRATFKVGRGCFTGRVWFIRHPG